MHGAHSSHLVPSSGLLSLTLSQMDLPTCDLPLLEWHSLGVIKQPEILPPPHFPPRRMEASLFFQECVGPGDGQASNVLGLSLLWSAKCFEIGSRWPPPPSQALGIKKRRRTKRKRNAGKCVSAFAEPQPPETSSRCCPCSTPNHHGFFFFYQ